MKQEEEQERDESDEGTAAVSSEPTFDERQVGREENEVDAEHFFEADYEEAKGDEDAFLAELLASDPTGQ